MCEETHQSVDSGSADSTSTDSNDNTSSSPGLNSEVPDLPASSLVATGGEVDDSASEEALLNGQSVNSPSGVLQDTGFLVKVVTPSSEVLEIPVNSVELVQEIHQVLMDREETCHRTCFSLQFNGRVLDNFTELRNVEGLKQGSVLKICEEPYTVREARIHLRHFRDLLKSLDLADAYNASECASLSFVNTITSGSILAPKRPKPDATDCLPPDYVLPGSSVEQRPLTPIMPFCKEISNLPCLKFLSLSGWNPPPGYRKMHGDLLYLQVLTMEDKRYHITSCTKGFFVNLSTEEVFNPKPAANKLLCHSLVDLLSNLSPGFKKNFTLVQKRRCQRHPFERMATPYQVHTWLVPKFDHSTDFVRAEDAFSFKLGYEEHIPGQTRDWNEELQTTRELPRKTVGERLLRERAIFKVHSDFVSAAARGAVAVADGSVMPINPGEEPKMQMFIWNNIFFSLGFDVKNHYEDYGGDAAAHVAPVNDLQGVKAYFNLDHEGLYVLGTVVIDYRGYRITAQSIIPGILERDQEQSVVYGSIDFGKNVVANDKYQELVSLEFCCWVVSEKGETVKLLSSVESKGIVGNDGRHYLLDLLRTFPPDVNYHEDAEVTDICRSNGYPRKHPHRLACLRHELVDSFVESRYIMFIKTAAYHLRKVRSQKSSETTGAQNSTTESDSTASKGEKASDETAAATVKDEELPEDEAKKLITSLSSSATETIEGSTTDIIRKAANAVGSLSPTVKHSDCEDLAKQRRLVRDAAEFLLTSQIPNFIHECLEHSVTPLDGSNLTEALHSRGINIRYLGKVAELLDSFPVLDYLKIICLNELLCRSAKHIMRPYLQSVEQSHLSAAITHFLNCLLGPMPAAQSNQYEELVARKKSKKRKSSRSSSADSVEWIQLSTSTLWQQIVDDIASYYGFTFPCSNINVLQEQFGVQKISILRRLCNITGVQVVLRDYVFGHKSKPPFVEEDIVNLFPVTKHVNPRASDAYNFYTTGQSKIQQGQLRAGYELVNEAHNLFNSIYGILHPEIAQCLRLLARLLYILGDVGAALEQQHKAVIISERCNGIDHPNTVLEYTHFALYCFANLHVTTALKLLYRARYLLLLAHGERHPHMALIDANIGLILNAVGEYDFSLRFLENALKLNLHYFGQHNLKVALSYHLVSRIHSLRGDYRTALQHEKEAYMIYKNLLGEEHERTKESGDCLKQLTQEAVAFQKRMNEVTKCSSNAAVSHLLPPLNKRLGIPGINSTLEVLNMINGIVFIQISAKEVEALRSELAWTDSAVAGSSILDDLVFDFPQGKVQELLNDGLD